MIFAKRTWLTVLACLACATCRAAAPPAQEPEARRAFEAMAAAYKGLSAYADHGEIRVQSARSGNARSGVSKVAIVLARPNKLTVETEEVRLVCDGDRLTTLVVPLKKYYVAPAPKTITLPAISNSSLGAVLFSGPSGPPMNLLWNLLLTDSAVETLLGSGAGLKREADREINGKPYQVLQLEPADGPPVRLLTDPKTHLLASMEVVIGSSELNKAEQETEVGALTVVWSAGAVSTEPPPETAFPFHPPEGATRVADLASRREVRAPRQDALAALVGKPAPDFTLNLLDGPDKIRKLSKQEVKGKVVLLDFWATWCGPCMEELPEIQKLVEQLADANVKDVLIVAVSQDNDAGDAPDIRRLVEKTLAGKELKLTRGPLSAVALDPPKDLGKAFHVQAIPTLVLIDRQGIVQAVHVGFQPDIRDTLAEQVDTVRKGISLVEPEEEPARPR